MWGLVIGAMKGKEIQDTFLINLELCLSGEKKKVDLEMDPLLCWALRVYIYTHKHADPQILDIT